MLRSEVGPSLRAGLPKIGFERYSCVGKACFKVNLTGFTGTDKRREMGGLIDYDTERDLNKQYNEIKMECFWWEKLGEG